MESFEGMLRANVELLTYVIFFGLLAGLGAMEAIWAMKAEGAQRRRRWTANFSLTAANIVVMGAIPVTALVAADLARANSLGVFNLVEMPFVVVLVGGFLARSLVSWAIHFGFHNIAVLWRVHRVHHTDTHLDVSTTVRFHPMEFLVSAPLVVATVMLFGIPPVVVMMFELFDAAIAVFSHANVRLPVKLDRFMSLIVVTPNLHRIHHSPVVRETNSNYGATLVVWDQLFGTLRQKPPAELARQPLGLSEVPEPSAHSLWFMLTLPFRPYKLSPAGDRKNTHDKSQQPEAIKP